MKPAPAYEKTVVGAGLQPAQPDRPSRVILTNLRVFFPSTDSFYLLETGA